MDSGRAGNPSAKVWRRTKSVLAGCLAGVVIGVPALALAQSGSGTIYCNSGYSQCTGSPGDDTMHDNDDSHAANIFADDNNYYDIVYAHGSNDYIEGSSGADYLLGHKGADSVRGSANTDPIDYVVGNDGNDVVRDVWPGEGYVHCSGCEKDRACGDDGVDTINILDGDGRDQYYGGGGDDSYSYDAGDGGAGTHDNCVAGHP